MSNPSHYRDTLTPEQREAYQDWARATIDEDVSDVSVSYCARHLEIESRRVALGVTDGGNEAFWRNILEKEKAFNDELADAENAAYERLDALSPKGSFFSTVTGRYEVEYVQSVTLQQIALLYGNGISPETYALWNGTTSVDTAKPVGSSIIQEAMDNLWKASRGLDYGGFHVALEAQEAADRLGSARSEPSCECGAAATGHARGAVGHSSWCPWFGGGR